MQKMERVEPWPAPPEDNLEEVMANYKFPGIVVFPKKIGWSMEELSEAARIIARCGITTEEAARALTPKKKPESIRDTLDAPMKKWREECKPRY